MKKHIHVACAIIRFNEKIFAAKRRADQFPPNCWELPGGKIEPNETPSAAIVRELFEELAILAVPEKELPHSDYDYGKFKVRLFPVICNTKSQDFTVKEHADAGWFSTNDCKLLEWSPADIPLLEKHIYLGD